ncbi:MAG: hypothetical protein AAB116_07770, partial [Candidatus Poribacteria bacterium]
MIKYSEVVTKDGSATITTDRRIGTYDASGVLTASGYNSLGQLIKYQDTIDSAASVDNVRVKFTADPANGYDSLGRLQHYSEVRYELADALTNTTERNNITYDSTTGRMTYYLDTLTSNATMDLKTYVAFGATNITLNNADRTVNTVTKSTPSYDNLGRLNDYREARRQIDVTGLANLNVQSIIHRKGYNNTTDIGYDIYGRQLSYREVTEKDGSATITTDRRIGTYNASNVLTATGYNALGQLLKYEDTIDSSADNQTSAKVSSDLKVQFDATAYTDAYDSNGRLYHYSEIKTELDLTGLSVTTTERLGIGYDAATNQMTDYQDYTSKTESLPVYTNRASMDYNTVGQLVYYKETTENKDKTNAYSSNLKTYSIFGVNSTDDIDPTGNLVGTQTDAVYDNYGRLKSYAEVRRQVDTDDPLRLNVRTLISRAGYGNTASIEYD